MKKDDLIALIDWFNYVGEAYSMCEPTPSEEEAIARLRARLVRKLSRKVFPKRGK